MDRNIAAHDTAAIDAVSLAPTSTTLTAEEAEVYDRGIRLWGLDAQQRMRASRVLIVGMGALGAEISKNSVLAGINVTIQDTAITTAADVGVQYFLKATHVGQNVGNVGMRFPRRAAWCRTTTIGVTRACMLVSKCPNQAEASQLSSSNRSARWHRWQQFRNSIRTSMSPATPETSCT